jgi:hypothetical protein
VSILRHVPTPLAGLRRIYQTGSQSSGRVARLEPGTIRRPGIEDITDVWERLHQRYAKILGLKHGDALTVMIDDASLKLSNAE